MKGSCLCGRNRYEVDRFIPHATHCHCTLCRKFHGAAFATYGVAERAEFRWLSPGDELAEYIDSNGNRRGFCKHCGSSLTFQASGEDTTIDIALGTLDEAPGLSPSAHIHVASKADWVEICDGLPQFPDDHDLP
jgi:hypothetical protein